MNTFNYILGIFLALFLLIGMYWLLYNTMKYSGDADLK
jgi:hypothetical protein